LPPKIVSFSSAQKFATKSFASAPDSHTDAMRRHLSEKPTIFFLRFYFVIFGCRSCFFQAFEPNFALASQVFLHLVSAEKNVSIDKIVASL
jgi:hypothetical protein